VADDPEKKTSTAPGPTGKRVAANIKAHRLRQDVAYAELSRRLEELGRPIATLGLSRIEGEKRRVDVDDLVAIARALAVNPLHLLVGEGADETQIEITPGVSITAAEAWEWVLAEVPRRDLTFAEGGPHWNLLVGLTKYIATKIHDYPDLTRGEGSAVLRTLEPLLANVLRGMDRGYNPTVYDPDEEEEGDAGE
jgi:transcriptional regulator with XRE-family HTH domain